MLSFSFGCASWRPFLSLRVCSRLLLKEKNLWRPTDYHTRNGLKGNAMKRVYVLEERGFVDNSDPVTKAEEWLSNDYCVPHKAMMRQDDNFAGEGTDTNKVGRTWIYDDDRGRNKVARVSTNHKA